MAAIIIEPQTYIISAGDVEVVSLDYTPHLAKTNANPPVLTELLTGTPTVTTDGSATLANKAVNTATYVDKYSNETVAVGAAVQFSITSAVAGTETITITVSTDASIARTFVRRIIITVQ